MPDSMHRTALRPDERRNQILDCALEVFARKGFHEASIADICSPARIARGTLYQYFKDKRDVLEALIDRIVSRIIEAVGQWEPFELLPGQAWTAADNIAFIEARCGQIMQVVFNDPSHGPGDRLCARRTGTDRSVRGRHHRG
jgi:AcrR family transcriptional regulator